MINVMKILIIWALRSLKYSEIKISLHKILVSLPRLDPKFILLQNSTPKFHMPVKCLKDSGVLMGFIQSSSFSPPRPPPPPPPSLSNPVCSYSQLIKYEM
jgi:hypothetical protein